MDLRQRKTSFKQSTSISGDDAAETLEGFSQHATIHGLYDLVYQKTLTARLSWILVFVLAVGMLMYETQMITMRYISQPTVSHITTTVPNYFPEVIYCPSTYVDPRKAETLGFDRDVYRWYKSLFTWISFFEAYYFDLMFNNMEAADYFSSSLPEIQKMGYKFQKFIMKHEISNFTKLSELVSFNEKDVITVQKQLHNPNISITKIHLLNSICYKVKDYTRYAEMEITHVNLQFFIHDIERTFPPYDEYDNLYIGDGMGVAPFGALSVAPFFDHSISITAVNYKRENLKRLQCQHDWKYADRDKCTMDCINKEMCLAFANCTFPVPWDDSIPHLCTLYSPVSCIGESTKRAHERQEIFDMCYQNCPKPCEMWLFQAVVTPTKRAGNMTRNLFRIKFADPSNTMQVVEVLTESWSTLLSNIGGTFSLWIGASLISFVQLASFLCSKLIQYKVQIRASRSGDLVNPAICGVDNPGMIKSPFD